MRNFNEIFRKNVAYDNIESHKKPWFHLLFRRYIFRKTTGEVKLTPPAVLGLKHVKNKLKKSHSKDFLSLSCSL